MLCWLILSTKPELLEGSACVFGIGEIMHWRSICILRKTYYGTCILRNMYYGLWIGQKLIERKILRDCSSWHKYWVWNPVEVCGHFFLVKFYGRTKWQNMNSIERYISFLHWWLWKHKKKVHNQWKRMLFIQGSK